MQISHRKKATGKYCCAIRCTQAPVEKKGGLCHKHYRRKRKSSDPVSIRFENFRGNAKRRGKEFTITLSQFREFCKITGYIINKGCRGYAATVDRIDNNRGYHIDNIQLLTSRQNIAKYHKEDKFEDVPF